MERQKLELIVSREALAERSASASRPNGCLVVSKAGQELYPQPPDEGKRDFAASG